MAPAGPKGRGHLAVLQTAVPVFTTAMGPLAWCPSPASFPETEVAGAQGILVFVRLLLSAPWLVLLFKRVI